MLKKLRFKNFKVLREIELDLAPLGTDVDADELRAHLARTLAKWMLPDAIIFVDELPHTATGKIQRFRLKGTP